MATLVISLLIVVIPVIIVLIVTATQLLAFSESLASSNAREGVLGLITDTSANLNQLLAPFANINIAIDHQGITDFLRNSVPAFARGLGNFALGLVGSVPGLAIAFIIYTFVFIELLVRGDHYIKGIYAISPFNRTITAHYLERVGLMANAMMKGQLFISMIISAISAVLLIPLGFGQYVFLFFVLFTILNLIPLGCGIIVMPLALYSAFTGDFWLGMIVLGLYGVAANIDSVLRPIFIPKKIQLSTALTMVSTFCGIAYFGILGVVYGPIIMILITTALSLYTEHKPKIS